MSSQDNGGEQGLVLTVVVGLATLVTGLVLGLGIYQSRHAPGATKVEAGPVSAVPVPAPASIVAVDAASAAQAASDAASIKVENGVVKFYFGSGKAELAVGAGDALVEVIKGATVGRKLVISGFHDDTGDAAKNAVLAAQRAMAVREALKAAGVAEQLIELKKPEPAPASGSKAEARRVEVSLR